MERKNEDNLSFAHDKSILKIIQLETLLFSDHIIKINELGMPQDRNIIITNLTVYNLKDKTLKRQILLSNIIGITISLISEEFVFHGKSQEYDYCYISDKKKKIIEAINVAYKQLHFNELPLCQVEDYSLRNYVTMRKEKKRDATFTRMPLDSNRISIKLYLKDSSFQWTNQPLSDGSEAEEEKQEDKVAMSDFTLLRLLKRGHYSKVFLAQYRLDKQYYAIKVMRKDNIIDNDTIDNLELEKRILSTVISPFICPVKMVFQTEERVYFVMAFIQGGELYTYMKANRTLTEDKVRFYSAQVAMALQGLHDLGLIYRDLKPENILLDKDGYLQLIDCGFCRFLKGNEKAMSFCGTPEFLSPEIISGEGHNKACDWWSFGILMYQMIFGIAPFYSRNIEHMYELIRSAELKFPKKVQISFNAQAIIIKLLNKDPAKRLGLVNGLNEIETEPFFSLVDFEKIKLKQVPAPYQPTIKSNSDSSMYEEAEDNKEDLIDSDVDEKTKMKIKMNDERFQFLTKKSLSIPPTENNSIEKDMS